MLDLGLGVGARVADAVCVVFQVRGVGLLFARLAFVRAAAAAASYRGKDIVTVAFPSHRGMRPKRSSAPCHWRRALCSVEMMWLKRQPLNSALRASSCVGVACALEDVVCAVT